jgi:hypothetical protein
MQSNTRSWQLIKSIADDIHILLFHTNMSLSISDINNPYHYFSRTRHQYKKHMLTTVSYHLPFRFLKPVYILLLCNYIYLFILVFYLSNLPSITYHHEHITYIVHATVSTITIIHLCWYIYSLLLHCYKSTHINRQQSWSLFLKNLTSTRNTHFHYRFVASTIQISKLSIYSITIQYYLSIDMYI